MAMHLSSFGLIALDGSVTKLEPNQDFANYQTSMSHYGTTLALKIRVDAAREKVMTGKQASKPDCRRNEQSVPPCCLK